MVMIVIVTVAVTMIVIMCRRTRPPARVGLISRRGAAPLADAVVDALKQAGIIAALDLRTAARRGVAVEGGKCAILAMAAGLVEAELGLDGGAVDTVGVKALASLLGELHVLLAALLGDGEGDLDVEGGHELRIRQLPNVHVVAADDPGEVLDVLLDLRQLEVVRRRLEEHLGGCAGEGDGRLEDDEGDEERDGRVGVLASGPAGEPDDESGGDDADVS